LYWKLRSLLLLHYTGIHQGTGQQNPNARIPSFHIIHQILSPVLIDFFVNLNASNIDTFCWTPAFLTQRFVWFEDLLNTSISDTFDSWDLEVEAAYLFRVFLWNLAETTLGAWLSLIIWVTTKQRNQQWVWQ